MDWLELFVDVLRGAVLVTGLVVIMMMMIECLNVESHGRALGRLRSSRFGGVLVSALLGSIPGCMGGFAAVSLYTHGLFSFGALVAMMIASSGDEAFVMLALMPDKAWWIFLILLGVALASGIIVDALGIKAGAPGHCAEGHALHDADAEGHGHGERHLLEWRRLVMIGGVLIFIVALCLGWLGDEDEAEAAAVGLNLLSEEWMYYLFAALSVGLLAVLVFAGDHFVEEHLWHHVVRGHLGSIFAWTFGALAVIAVLLQFVDIASWVSDNTALMIVLATLVGVIPESGPHLLFVTLYASGIVPLPVLLASCISQDGHASLPLLAETKRGFALAKVVNCFVALVVGFGFYWLI